MNKYLFSLPMMAAAFGGMLVSCSSDEDLIETAAYQGQEIEFTLDINSRGNDVTTENLESIWVYAYSGSGESAKECFALTEFVRNDYGIFKPETPIKWDSSWGNEVNFCAFGPTKDNYLHYIQNGVLKSIEQISCKMTPSNPSITINTPEYASEMQDMITAETTVTNGSNGTAIPLKFRHIYSKVDIKVKKAEDSEYDIDVYGALIAFSTPDTSTDYLYKNYTYRFNQTENPTYDTNRNGYGVQVSTGTPVNVTSEEQFATGEQNSFYIIPQKFESLTFCPYSKPANKYQNLHLLSIVRDKSGNQIFPTEHDLTITNRVTANSSALLFQYFNPDPEVEWAKIGRSYIPFGQTFEYEAGHHYVITLDLTNGIGYTASTDPENPDEPVLKMSLGAKVEVEEWVDGELVPVQANKDDE